jgi:drug/metabolite transporter (DMT)-like permease
VKQDATRAEGSHTILYLLIAAMVLFWSANYIIGKIALREIPPLLAGGLRVAMAGVFMLPVYASQRGGTTSWSRRDLPMLVYLGVFGVTLNQLFFMIGLSRTSVAHSALLIAMTPIFVLIIAAIAKQERITLRKAAGMLIAFGGVGILNLLPVTGPPGSQPTVVGDVFIFLAAATFALFTVIGKTVSLRLSGVTVNTFSYLTGAVALAPIAIWQGRDFAFARVSAAGWMSLVYMALFSSVICYLIYYYALGQISASRVAAFSYLQPVVATIMAAAVLRERVTLPLIAGGVVIFAGVFLTERG